LTPVTNLPRVTRTPSANFATSSAGVVDTGGKFATGVNYIDGKFAPSTDTAGCKFAISINSTGGKQ
jgi:hypothetical protein